jgi:hypothetical protein
MPPTADIVQMPPTQYIVQSPPKQDILQMSVQLIDIQPLKRALGGNRYLEFTEWNGSKRVGLRLLKDGTVPTKEGVSLYLDQWKALCNMSDVIDDLLSKVIDTILFWYHMNKMHLLQLLYQCQKFQFLSYYFHYNEFSLTWIVPHDHIQDIGLTDVHQAWKS